MIEKATHSKSKNSRVDCDPDLEESESYRNSCSRCIALRTTKNEKSELMLDKNDQVYCDVGCKSVLRKIRKHLLSKIGLNIQGMNKLDDEEIKAIWVHFFCK